MHQNQYFSIARCDLKIYYVIKTNKYQIRVGPVSFKGSWHLSNNKVIHLLRGLWVISAKYIDIKVVNL